MVRQIYVRIPPPATNTVFVVIYSIVQQALLLYLPSFVSPVGSTVLKSPKSVSCSAINTPRKKSEDARGETASEVQLRPRLRVDSDGSASGSGKEKHSSCTGPT